MEMLQIAGDVTGAEMFGLLFAGSLLGVVLGGLIFAFGFAFKLDSESHGSENAPSKA